MIRWLSRRHPRYIRSLVYMLQASEYNISDFFKWHKRTIDFTAVEHRKRLVFTPKATLLFIAGWATLLITDVVVLVLFFSATTWWHYALAIVLAVESPLLILGALVFAVFKLHILQIPVEWVLLSRAHARLASHKAVKIAIAGSFGKTSAREVLRTVLSEGKNVAAPGGSYNTPIAISRFVQSLKGDEEVLIFELGEYYPGDVQKLCELIQPDIGIITGVNEAHLEKFGSLENTTSTIFELADFLKDKPVYVNSENELARGRGSGKSLYGRDGVGDWRVESPQTGLDGTSFVLKKGGATLRGSSKLLGLHHIGILSVAADIGTKLGLTVQQIERGIEHTRAFEHRLEPRNDGGIITLDDSYNGSPDGVKAIIEFLTGLKGRRWYVTPGLVEMGKRKEEVHKTIGEQLAAAGIEKVVLIRNSVTPYIEEGLKKADYKGEIMWFDEGLSAYAALPHLTVKGDVVLLQNDWPDQYA